MGKALTTNTQTWYCDSCYSELGESEGVFDAVNDYCVCKKCLWEWLLEKHRKENHDQD